MLGKLLEENNNLDRQVIILISKLIFFLQKRIDNIVDLNIALDNMRQTFFHCSMESRKVEYENLYHETVMCIPKTEQIIEVNYNVDKTTSYMKTIHKMFIKKFGFDPDVLCSFDETITYDLSSKKYTFEKSNIDVKIQPPTTSFFDWSELNL
jgi:hypothetical protein